MLSSFFTQKRMAVEPEKHEDGLNKDGAAGEVNLISQPPELKEPLASSSTSITTYNCPLRDFAQEAKSRGGTLVARVYIKETTYSGKIGMPEKTSICLNRARMEPLGNADVSIVYARE